MLRRPGALAVVHGRGSQKSGLVSVAFGPNGASHLPVAIAGRGVSGYLRRVREIASED
jgi:hypothetical protein